MKKFAQRWVPRIDLDKRIFAGMFYDLIGKEKARAMEKLEYDGRKMLRGACGSKGAWLLEGSTPLMIRTGMMMVENQVWRPRGPTYLDRAI